MYGRTRQFGLVFVLLCGLIFFVGCEEQGSGANGGGGFAITRDYEESSFRVRVRVSEDQIAFSDLTVLEVSVGSSANFDYTYELDKAAITQFQIRNTSHQQNPASAFDTLVYELEPLELGHCEIPALTVTFERADANDVDAKPVTIETQPMQVIVTSSVAADPNSFAIADIEDVVEVKADTTWMWISTGAACLIVIGILVGRRMKPKKEIEIRRVYKPAHEIALEVLGAIAKEKLVEHGKVKEFYEKLSGCLRQYIENRFSLRAPEQTTEEFLEELRNSDALKLEYKQQLQKFLEHCDLVKFARYEPQPEQINESLTMAEEFVQKTKSQTAQVDVTERHSAKEGREGVDAA